MSEFSRGIGHVLSEGHDPLTCEVCTARRARCAVLAEDGIKRRVVPRRLVRSYLRGRFDYEKGVPIDRCPYPDHRTWNNKVTFSRAYRNSWRDGWNDAAKEAPRGPVEGGHK